MNMKKQEESPHERFDGYFDEPGYLNHVSRIKHEIYTRYLGAWLTILSRGFNHLRVFDCFAGDGRYVDEHGQALPGSPQRAISITSDVVAKSKSLSVAFGFIEQDQMKAERLHQELLGMKCPRSISLTVFAGDAHHVIEKILRSLSAMPGMVPTLFFVDPYGHPLPIPVMRKLLAIPKAEILVNLMWFRISMDLRNPGRIPHLDHLFGHEKWKEQKFNQMAGIAREKAFVDYFEQEVSAAFCVRCAMPYSPEDRVTAPEKRTKYYLLHFSSHHRAANAMKPVMRRAERSLTQLHGPAEQLPFGFADPRKAGLADLKGTLCGRFDSGTQLTFREVLDRTAKLPNIESEYRRALKELEVEKRVDIDRRESKRDGLNYGDVITFR
jgi:three-Cys-motif partner protein